MRFIKNLLKNIKNIIIKPKGYFNTYMIKPLSRTDYKFLFALFPVLFFIAYFQMRGILPPQYSPTNGAIVWPLRISVFYIGIKAISIYGNQNYHVLLYLLYSILSVASYIINGFPLSLYLLCCITILGPVLFVYVGMDTNSKYYHWFYKSFFWACAGCCTVGLILYFLRPEWYNTAILAISTEKQGEGYTDEKLIEWYRYSSYLTDSYDVSYITMASLPMGLFLWANETNRNKKRLYVIGIIVVYFSALLCQQRVAMFSTTLVLLAFSYLRNKKNVLLVLGALLLIALIGFLLINYAGDNEVVSLLSLRFGQMNVFDALGERSNQTERIMKAWSNYPFGEGIGSACVFARQLGMVSITDGAYVEVLYELGIIGFIIFISLILKSFFKAFKNKNYLFVEVSIVGSFMVAMVGACPFVYFFYMIPFWLSIGRIMNKDYLAYLKKNQLKIG